MEIRLEGTFNIRDLGGMPAAGGRKVKRGRMIRSDALSNLTPEGEAVLLKEYGLANILDLRTESELGEQPPQKISRYVYRSTGRMISVTALTVN